MSGLFVPNGMFIHYVAVQFSSVTEALNNMLAFGFTIDACMASGLPAWWFARHLPAQYGRKMFVVPRLIGVPGFSLPFHCDINK